MTKTTVFEGRGRSCRWDSHGKSQGATTERLPKFPRTEARRLRSWGLSWLPPPKLILLSINVFSFRVIRSCPRQNEILPRVLKRHRYTERSLVIGERASNHDALISRICKYEELTGQLRHSCFNNLYLSTQERREEIFEK